MNQHFRKAMIMIIIGVSLVIFGLYLRPNKDQETTEIAGISRSTVSTVIAMVGFILIGYQLFLGRYPIF